MTPITVEGVQLHYVPTIPSKFDCSHCALSNGEPGCVRIWNGELYFEKREPNKGQLYCINAETNVVFINNTPEDIARYVAARLENS
jgi:hypothetical protein